MNKVVIITGAATGLGRSTALKLAEQGYKLSLVDFNEKDGQQTTNDVKEKGAEAIFVKADISNENDVQNYVTKTEEAFGRVDFFINNAGILFHSV
ncbi:SDR family NAD(P)-dependent oxidoreductase [Paenibacillus xylanexedens]|uniref:SDR family NAD(P)-dependent oxidoreductase n=1 Tax=Paenibacillus xylanexedens TaxID=528191 RepID=UPI000F528909|nr:SDR family NAD(P)-dependent oxidoreductase [Paenibacillus xylanexedens]RPK31475.1 3-oxoacyl-[acyl-carrier protein] reductase [Paenibacillus xylanexedens]